MDQLQIKKIIDTNIILLSIFLLSLIFLGLICAFFGYTYIIAFSIGIILIIILIKKPFWGFLTYIALTYLRPFDLFPTLDTFRPLLFLLAFLVLQWFIKNVSINKMKIILMRIDKSIIIFLIVMILSTVTSIWVSASISYFIDFSKLVVLYMFSTQILGSTNKLKHYILVILSSVTFVCLVQIYTYFTLGLTRATGLGGYGIHIGPLNLEGTRSIGPISEYVHGVGAYSSSFLANSSELGLAILIFWPFAYYFINCFNKKWISYCFMLICCIFFLSLIITGSRGAAVGAVFMLFMIFLKSKYKSRFIVVMTLAGIISFAFISDKYIGRISSIAKYQEDASVDIRLDLWKAGLRMIADRPLLGVGVGNFSTAYGSEYRMADSANLWWKPHNNFIQVASEMGLLGLATFIFIMVLIIRENRRTKKYLQQADKEDIFLYNCMQAIEVGLVGYIVAGFFITSTYYPHLYNLALMARVISAIVQQKVIKKSLN